MVLIPFCSSDHYCLQGVKLLAGLTKTRRSFAILTALITVIYFARKKMNKDSTYLANILEQRFFRI